MNADKFIIKFGDPEDTITAIASPPGIGAIGVIRVSGADSIKSVGSIFTGGRSSGGFPPVPRMMTLGKIRDPENNVLVDQVLIAFFPSPKSYTGEDMFEIFSHGGTLVIKEIVSLLCRFGARPAFPGEFTFRAFHNGKMDLTQAEAVLDVISARNKHYLDASLRRLNGSLGNSIRKLRSRLVDILASIEVAIDYPEENTPRISADQLSIPISDIYGELKRLLDNSESMRVSNEGLKVAVVGRPNVGKSSLVNRLLGKDRVIVSDIPGTTRDLVGDWLAIEGYDFFLMDTAGITSSSMDKIEEEGVKRTLDYLKQADIAIAVFDSSQSLNNEDFRVIEAAKQASFSIPAISKIDLNCEFDDSALCSAWPDVSPVKTSSLTGQGLPMLINSLGGFSKFNSDILSDFFVLNFRHVDLIRSTLIHLQECLDNIGTVPDDILSIDIRDSISILGEITGENTSDDILSSIFSNFCVGK